MVEKGMPKKANWKAKASTKVHVVRAQMIGCMPDYYAVYIGWHDANRALRDYADENGYIEKNGDYRYDHPTKPFYVVHDTLTLGEIAFPYQYKGLTIAEAVENLNQ